MGDSVIVANLAKALAYRLLGRVTTESADSSSGELILALQGNWFCTSPSMAPQTTPWTGSDEFFISHCRC